MKELFAERYGYIKPSDELIIECMPQDVINALCNCINSLENNKDVDYNSIKNICWIYFFNEKQSDYDRYFDCITDYLDDDDIEWYYKLSLIDFVIKVISNLYNNSKQKFVKRINSEFERLNYGYRIINNFVTPITAKEEIESIEEAIDNAKNNIKEHLYRALLHLVEKENPDYRNSIKESISAVGALCREMTGENDFGKALFVLEKKQGKLHPQLKAAFDNLYNYVNEKQSGIRHELMDESGTYVPTYHEAKFMLVTCSAFINYINGKFN